MRLELFWRGLAIVVGLMLVAVCIVAVLNPSVASRPWYEYIAAVLLGVAVVVFLRSSDRHLGKISERAFLTAVIAAFLISRLAWIWIVPTLPFSDFASYNAFADVLRQARPIEDLWKISHNLSTQPWGYPISLAAAYAIFGSSLIVGKLLNLVAGLISLWLFYKLTSHLCGPLIARAATFLFAIWPAQLMLTSVLASEHLGLMFVLASFLFLTRLMESDKHESTNIVLAGIFLAIAATMRSSLIIALPAGVLAILLARLELKKKLATAALVVMTFVAAYGIYLGCATLVYKVAPLPRSGLNFLFGTNAESNGRWNESDARIISEHDSIDEVDRIARAAALQRIKDAPLTFIMLMFRKVPVTWADDTYSASYSMAQLGPSSRSSAITSQMPFISAVSQFFHIVVLALGAIGCFKLRRYQTGLGLMLIFLLGGTLLHSVLETQPRYHFVLEPSLLMLAALGAIRQSTKPDSQNATK